MSRIPVDYLAHRQADQALRRHLGVSSERELLDRLGCDFFYLPGRDLSQNEGILPCYRGRLPAMTATERTCPLGIRWRRGAYDAKFSVDEAISGPFQRDGITIEDIRRFPWPTAADFDFTSLRTIAEVNADRVRVGGMWTGIMGDSYRMYGFQRFLTDLAVEPELMHALIGRMSAMYLEINDAYFTALKGRMEVWFFGNDFGSQEGLLISRRMWERFFLEHIRRHCALAHDHGLQVMMHSCGAISDLIPDLIAAGVDILDPVQVTARGMAPRELADRFGSRISFHGGIDTQGILPRGSLEDVRRHVREVAAALAPGGRYIFAPSQILNADIPVENIVAMYLAIAELNHERAA